MSSVTAVDGVGMENAGTQQAVLERFLLACTGGPDIEAMILRDAARQRRIAGQMRRTHGDCRRRAVAEAAAKIRQAARRGLWSALIGAGVQVGVAVACWALGPASDLTQSGAGAAAEGAGQAADPLWKKLTRGGLRAFGAFCDKYTPYFSEAQAEAQGQAQLLQTEAGIRGQMAGDASEWLREIKDLESKLISHLEKIEELDHQAKKTVIERMGR